MWRDISLANKCLLLFGAAIVLIVFAALLAPWLRMNALVGEAQNELSRQLVAAWERADRENPGGQASEAIGVTRISLLDARELAKENADIARAIEFFEAESSPIDYSGRAGTARLAGTTTSSPSTRRPLLRRLVSSRL